jgi:hypothetical protein
MHFAIKRLVPEWAIAFASAQRFKQFLSFKVVYAYRHRVGELPGRAEAHSSYRSNIFWLVSLFWQDDSECLL